MQCVRPSLEALDEALELRGHVEPPPGGDLPVASQVAGRIVEVHVHEGQRVAAGDVIASVDDLASRDALRQAQASASQALAAQINADATLARTRELVSRGIAARQELDDALAKAETERQSVAGARAALDLARHTLGRVQVRAAFGGVVTRVFRGAGAIVDGSALTPIAQVAAASAEFVADATERDLARIRAGQRATVALVSRSAELSGSVRTISSALDPTTGLGVVRVTLETPSAPPLIGSHGRARIVVGHREQARVLPARALRGAVADGAEVVVCAGGEARVQPVRVGYRDAQRFEVLSGLGPNDRVATDHVLGLETGTRLVETP